MKTVIEVCGVQHDFGGRRVLHDVSFEVGEGEVVGIIGPGGVGKTVLLKIVAGLIQPRGGGVCLGGQEISSLGAMELFALRQRMGMLFQNYALFDFLTVGENAAFPLLRDGRIPRDECLARASDLLAELGLAGTEHQVPGELSGGMKKRVAMARATIHEPDIVLYDDPTAGLDPVTSSKIFLLIRRLHDSRGSTDLVVSHDLDRLGRICDRFILLHEGRVHFDGTLGEARERCVDPVICAFFFGKDQGPEVWA